MSRFAQDESGQAVLTVSVIGLLISLVGVGFFNASLRTEQRAIASYLAEIRAHWAISGQFTYQASRLRVEGGCACDFETSSCKTSGKTFIPTCNSDLDRQLTLINISSEIGIIRRWSYANSGINYYLDIRTDNLIDNGDSATNNGHLKTTMKFPVSNASDHPALIGLPSRLKPYEFRFCTGLPDTSTACQSGVNSIPDNASGIIRLKSLRRPTL